MVTTITAATLDFFVNICRRHSNTMVKRIASKFGTDVSKYVITLF